MGCVSAKRRFENSNQRRDFASSFVREAELKGQNTTTPIMNQQQYYKSNNPSCLEIKPIRSLSI